MSFPRGTATSVSGEAGTLRASFTSDKWLVVILLLQALHACGYVLRSSTVVDGIRYFCLMDDMMVSMRYAKHLGGGLGCVWNVGEPPVEGFSNPLWVAVMAVVHLLPMPGYHIAAVVQAIAGAGLLATTLLAYLIARQLGRSAPAGIIAAVLTATYLPLTNWMLQGTEVALLTPLVCGAVLTALRSDAGPGSFRTILLLGAVATAVRMDGVVPFIVIVVSAALGAPSGRLAKATVGMTVLGGVLAIQALLRHWYFGDWLPNTYYLKMTGYPSSLRIARGVAVGALFALSTLPVGLLAWRARAHARQRGWQIVAAVFLGQLSYSAYVGGDAWEWWGGANRFIAIAMPLLFAAAAVTICDSDVHRRSSNAIARLGPAVIVVIGLVALSNTTPGAQSLRHLFLTVPPIETDSNWERIKESLAVRAVTSSDARIAVTWAGSLPYFSERPAVDLLGKNDRYVARQPMHPVRGPLGIAWFWPGHQKWDADYSIGRYRPDLVVQHLRDVVRAPMPLLDEHYHAVEIRGRVMYVRNGTAKVHTGR